MNGADDIKYMRRCIDLASGGEGLTYPNPMVGAVIVWKGQIIGEGYHLRAGEPHAEVNAINSVKDRSLLKESTMYVSLEPCSHFGRTPPCADRIAAEGIPRVVIGAVDTSDKVAGRGIERLRNAGCEVITGVLEKECRYLNRRFFTAVEKKRPYIILKWAQSADGFIDRIRTKETGSRPVWITGNPEKVLVHRWRSIEQSVLAGAGTVRADDPQLNVREWTGNQPLRLILTRSGNVGQNMAFARTSGTYIVFTFTGSCDLPDKVQMELNDDKPASVQIADYLYEKGIQSLFVEGGADVHNHFISTGMWDEARIFTGQQIFGGGVKAPVLKNESEHYRHIVYANSVLDIYERDSGAT